MKFVLLCGMRALIQRVSTARVRIKGETHSAIDKGLVVLLGIEIEDTADDVAWLARKILQMRIMEDDEGKMNRSVIDVKGSMLVVSQFTLHASSKKGNRPSFIKAARPDQAVPLYQQFIQHCANELEVQSGSFGANMKVELTNDGPVTIWLDSKKKE